MDKESRSVTVVLGEVTLDICYSKESFGRDKSLESAQEENCTLVVLVDYRLE